MGEEYRENSEKKDIRLFRTWNEENNFFSSWTPCETFAPYDVDAIDKKGRKCKIELKYRDMPSNQYDSYFIEADKLADGLLFATIEGLIPLYVNFFDDNNVAIWRLDKLKEYPKKRKIHRANKGYNVNDAMPCYRLPIASAYMSTFGGINV